MKSFIKGVVVLFVLGGISYYAYTKYTESKEKEESPTYLTERVRRGKIEHNVQATGTLEAKKVVKVGAQVSGEISELYVDIGDRLKKGDPIAKIDARLQDNRRQTARANLLSARAALDRARVSLLKASQTNDRVKQLAVGGAASTSEVESSEAAYRSAQSDVEQAKAALKSRQIELENASLNIGYTSVTSPIDGVVISVAVEQGNTVNAVNSSPTLVTVAQVDSMLVKAEIAEADVSKIKPGLTAHFTLLGDTTPYQATIESVDPAPLTVSDGRPSTTQQKQAVYYYAKLATENPEERMRIGMTAMCTITVESRDNALLIPMSALKNMNMKSHSGEAQIDVLENGAPVEKNIHVGINDGVKIEVLKGLKENDEVVVSTATKQNLPTESLW